MKTRKLWKSTAKKVFAVRLDNGRKVVVRFDKNGNGHMIMKEEVIKCTGY